MQIKKARRIYNTQNYQTLIDTIRHIVEEHAIIINVPLSSSYETTSSISIPFSSYSYWFSQRNVQ